MKGYFFTLEGADGSGKTSIIKELKERLEKLNFKVIATREPGGSLISEEIRKIILDPNNTQMDVRTEALLYAASRRQHLIEVIIPALKEGKIVLCDRYVDSSLAYQGFGRDIGFEEVLKINEFAIDNYLPDLTLYIDVRPSVGLARIKKSTRIQDRLDLEKISFHEKTYLGYQEVLRCFPKRVKRVLGEASLKEVIDAAYLEITKFLRENNELQ